MHKLCAALLPALMILGLATSACAQTFDFEKDRKPVASLDGKWRFHPGDDPDGERGGKPVFAQPGFDDMRWPLLDSGKSWYVQGYPGLSGWAWYRFSVQLPAGAGPLTLRLPPIPTAYEAFADGQRIGVCGRPYEGAFLTFPRSCTFAVAMGDDVHARTLTLALRVWHDPRWSAYSPGGPEQLGAELGSAPVMVRRTVLEQVAQAADYSDLYINAILRAVIGIVVLGLYFLRRGEREYLWFALIELFGCADDLLNFIHYAYSAIPIQLFDLLDATMAAGFWLAGLFFVAIILRGRRGLWFRLCMICILISPLSVPLYWPGWVPVPVSGLLDSALVVPSQLWILITLAARARRRDPDALLLLVPVLLVDGFYVVSNIFMALEQFNLIPFSGDLFQARFNLQPFPIGLYTMFNMAYSVALLGFLIRRMSLSRRQEEQLEGQLEAARQVQQRLVPAQVPAIAGLSISAAYQPASQVGGDFYQVLTQHDGAALILVGDVSGKGLKAAMNGVLAIGALRALAAEQLSPGPLLERLNNELAHSLDGGFITCLCVHLAPNGEATVANAGHLSPYCNGEEVAVEPGLPLGIVPGAEYAETHLTLAPGETLTLLSDGVVEARNAAGELFGFERTRAISSQAAEKVAQAAQDFGQDDDITVLNVTLNAGSVAHA